MKLTYEEYMRLIPAQTKKMVEATLPYLWVYIKKNKKIKLKNTESCYTTGKMPMAISALLGAAEDPEIKSMFEGKGFNPSKISISIDELPKLTEEQKKEIFEQAEELFTPYVDVTKYMTIQPIDLINRAITLDDGIYSFRDMLNYIGVSSELKTRVVDIMKNVHRNQELLLERELFADLPISTINYLETASKIRTIIVNAYANNGIQEQELLKNDDSYIVPMSLLLALYEYEGQEKNEIIEYFKSKGVTMDVVKRYFSAFTIQNIRYTDRNLESVKVLYKKYFSTGINKDVKAENIQVVDVLSNVLDRNFTGVITIDKLFEKIGTSTSEFANLKKSVETETIRKKAEAEMNYAKSFYKELRRDTKDFINLTTQIYQLLLKKMQEGKHNTEILNNLDDADTLALYIASHFYNTDFEVFYVEHGVIFDKVMKLLGISITMEEIKQEELNQKLVVDRFKRFVTSGVNTNKRPENIFINDVVRNLCNRDFNKSMIMENVFEEIRRDIDLPANFMITLENYLKNKEEERKRKLTEEYFLDKSNEVYNFLENTCKAYTTLRTYVSNQKFQDEELITLALLYALFESSSEMKELYEHMGLDKSKLNKYLNIDFNRYVKGDLDIDLILNKIDPYINQIKDVDIKKNLTIEEIAANIFTSKRTKTLQLSRLLAQYGLTYESFDDFTVVKKKLEEEKREKAIVSEADDLMVGCNGNAIDIIRDATKIFQVIEQSNSANLTSSDIADISMLLSLLGRSDLESYKYFGKYNVKGQDVINLLELPKNLNSKYYEKNYRAKYFLDYFKEYGSTYSYPKLTDNDMLNVLLGKNSSIIKNSLEALGVDFEIFTRECYTRKDYESTLTIDDRRSILDKAITPEVNTTNTTSIVTYGSELSKHTSFINEHCTELVLKDQTKEATETIQSVLDKIYEKRKVPVRQQTWFEKLVGAEVETSEELKVNGVVINDLKSVVSQYIAPIREDIKTFDSLVRYLETYRKKVIEHREKATQMLAQLTEESKVISEDDFEKLLRMQTYIRAVKSKKDSFELTNQLVKQYIYKTYLLMQNDLVTLSGLEMSRDVLIPLLEAEMIIGNSIQNQTNGAVITQNIVKLLGEVVSRNTVGIQQSLETIKRLGIPEENLLVLSKDIAKYLEQISELTDPDTVHIGTIPQNEPTLELPNSSGRKK